MTARIGAAAIAAALGQFPPTLEQTAVIESALGPALVIAGAGSGKTETMAGRVVWLVANGIVRRDQVLGLTFTRKAAGELAERIQRRLARLAEFERRGLLPHLEHLHAAGELDVFARLAEAGDRARHDALDALAARIGAVADSGADSADDLLDRPTVSTYNSFADAIVRENAVRIGRDAEAVVLSESAAWLLMRRVVLSSDDPALDAFEGALRTLVDHALRVARDAVDNLVDLDDLERFPERFRDVLERPSESARTTVYADIRTDAAAVDRLALFARLARAYADRKRRQGVIDFADQVAGAYEIALADPGVVAELRDRYRVVLLDEYQDTSVVQTLLLSRLFARIAVMAVGDPHQAIYGWRGASAGNLEGFPAAFAPDAECARFSLLTSWRNSPAVLAAASAVLAPLAARAGVAVGELRARPGAAAGEVRVVAEPDLDAETDAVARWFAAVRRERAAAGGRTTGAILFRAKKHMPRFAEALARHGIPHRMLGLGGLLSTPEIVDIVSALRVLSDPTAGSALIRLLSGPRWAVGVADLSALADLARRLARPAPAAADGVLPGLRATGPDDTGSLVDALDFFARTRADHTWLSGFTADARERLREAAGVFAGLRQAAATLPIPELVRAIEIELRLDIELAANEARGPARTASAQVRAFVDEVGAFLSADEQGSITSLLAWLDYAERSDDLAPRTDPPEEDVVQLLTIHGAKGLEWDAVAVVRLVEGELPTSPRETRGWLGAGVLPYEFRGDAPWLPDYRWEAREAPTQQALKRARDAFIDAHRQRTLEEDRRLAYVAVTRARDHLLLSGSFWAGTSRPRELSRFVLEIGETLGIPAPDADPGEDPYADAVRILNWPIDPLGARRPAVEAAAAAVTRALEAPRLPADHELALLLAEREERQRPAAAAAPVRIPASAYKDFVGDYAAAVAAVERPLPERPYAETTLGTRFHAWVERRAGISAMSSLDDGLWLDGDAGEPEGRDPDAAFRRLVETFERSEWGSLRPIEVETEIDFRHVGLDGNPHVVVCKLDAVYRREDRGGRIEIVDWKTGRAPRTDAESRDRMVQLELYRRAYHERHGVPLDEIDVALFYVAEDRVIRG